MARLPNKHLIVAAMQTSETSSRPSPSLAQRILYSSVKDGVMQSEHAFDSSLLFGTLGFVQPSTSSSAMLGTILRPTPRADVSFIFRRRIRSASSPLKDCSVPCDVPVPVPASLLRTAYRKHSHVGRNRPRRPMSRNFFSSALRRTPRIVLLVRLSSRHTSLGSAEISNSVQLSSFRM